MSSEPVANFTLESLLDALNEPPTKEDKGWFSMVEICDGSRDSLQRSDNWIMERMRVLFRQGKIERKQRTVENMAGALCHIPVYRLKKPKEG